MAEGYSGGWHGFRSGDELVRSLLRSRAWWERTRVRLAVAVAERADATLWETLRPYRDLEAAAREVVGSSWNSPERAKAIQDLRDVLVRLGN